MTRSTISALALGALVAGALGAGIDTARAQTTQPQGSGTETYGVTPLGASGSTTGNTTGTMGTSGGTPATSTTNARTGNVGPGIGPGTLGGVGPPTDGLDSNPYADASPRVRKALGADHRAKQSASAPHGKAKSSSTLN